MFKEESYRIIGACFEVYTDRGNGLLEAVYQQCLALEFGEQQIRLEEKPRLRLGCKGRPLKHEHEPDFLCIAEIIVEIKTAKTLAAAPRTGFRPPLPSWRRLRLTQSAGAFSRQPSRLHG